LPSAAAATPGDQLWVSRYDGHAKGQQDAYALGVSPDGSKLFVTGQGAKNYVTVAYDAATGAQLWVSRYNGPGDGTDRPSALVVSPDGSKVYVTGQSVGSGRREEDYATVAYDAATGAQLWVKRYNGPGNYLDWAFSLGISPDGAKLFVTGASFGSATGGDYATIATTPPRVASSG
jgi:DNA-binding beta-propeller fold protein YncE